MAPASTISQWQALGDLFAEKGNRQMPNTGWFTGPAKITAVEIARNGMPRSPRTNLGPHIMVQPVIDVAQDGRSSRYRVRLFQLSSSISRPASIGEGMYPNNQAVLEDGTWKIWSITVDEFYYNGSITNGWSKIPPRPPGALAGGGTTARRNEEPPAYKNIDMGRREESFGGGPGVGHRVARHQADVVPLQEPGKRPRAGHLLARLRHLHLRTQHQRDEQWVSLAVDRRLLSMSKAGG